VSFLLATVDDQSQRGLDVPRPYAVQPPLDGHTLYQPGDKLEFGLTLFARARDLFPYIVLGAQRLAQTGLGKGMPDARGRFRRGTLAIRSICAENPLSGQIAPIMNSGDTLVHMPDIPITHDQVMTAASALSDGDQQTVTLRFLTPLRLVDQRCLVRRPDFRILVQRLLERLSALARTFSSTPLQADFARLIAEAAAVKLADDRTHWVELESYSTRLGRPTPLGGLVGQATYHGALGPFWPYLIWGQFTQVGKDAVKGNGLYQCILSSSNSAPSWASTASG